MEPSTIAEVASLASGTLFGSGSAVVTAVSTDTGSFQYPSTSPGTFHVGAELVTRGADLGRRSLPSVTLFQLADSGLRRMGNFRVYFL